MGGYIFLGVFAAVTLAIVIGVVRVKRKLKRFSREVLGTEDLGQVVDALQNRQAVEEPKSVSGMDSILMPQILKDFPDFDANLGKTYARKYIKEKLADKGELDIHRVVFSQYLSKQAQKTIVMQISLAYQDGDRIVQTRYSLDYTYKLSSEDETIAANCPNCGGALHLGERICSYCGCQVVNVLENTWKFTRLEEI